MSSTTGTERDDGAAIDDRTADELCRDRGGDGQTHAAHVDRMATQGDGSTAIEF